MTETKTAKLEDLKAGASVEGLTPSGTTKIVNVEWFGDQAVKVIFEDAEGNVQDRLVYRGEEHSIKIASAGQLQPHHIQSFFIEAFKHLGGRIKNREHGRFEITHVPVLIRERDRLTGTGAPVQKRFERICFDKEFINQQPVAEFVCPGHPLLEAVTSLIREKYGHLMKQGAVMVDEADIGEDIQAVFLMEHSVEDGRKTSSGKPQVVSQRLQFASIAEDGSVANAGIAPHLNLRAATTDEISAVKEDLSNSWLSDELETKIKNFAILELAQAHLKEVRERRLPEIEKTESEVQARLKKEINHWDSRAAELREQANAGKKTRLNWENAQRRAEDLADHLQRRMKQLAQEKAITAMSPVVLGGLIVIPKGLLNSKLDATSALPAGFAENAASRREIEIIAMDAVMAVERALGNQPSDVSAQKVGYDILSFDPNNKRQRFIEVKGRIDGADTITVTRNEIITSLNKPEDFILAIVQVKQGFVSEPRYVWQPFAQEPEFGITAVQMNLRNLLEKSQPPH